jgi:hypothetical protein
LNQNTGVQPMEIKTQALFVSVEKEELEALWM